MKLKIGIIGYCSTGKKHYLELRRSNEFEICGIFDKDNVDEFCRADFYTNFKEFIEVAQPQAVVLCSPREGGGILPVCKILSKYPHLTSSF